MKLIKNLFGIAAIAVLTISTTNVKAQELLELMLLVNMYGEVLQFLVLDPLFNHGLHFHQSLKALS